MKFGDAERLALIREIYEIVLDGTATFQGRTGMKLAYLLGAIAKGDGCEFTERSRIVQLLHAHCPSGHPVWGFIKIGVTS